MFPRAVPTPMLLFDTYLPINPLNWNFYWQNHLQLISMGFGFAKPYLNQNQSSSNHHYSQTCATIFEKKMVTGCLFLILSVGPLMMQSQIPCMHYMRSCYFSFVKKYNSRDLTRRSREKCLFCINNISPESTGNEDICEALKHNVSNRIFFWVSMQSCDF